MQKAQASTHKGGVEDVFKVIFYSSFTTQYNHIAMCVSYIQ